MMKPDIEAQSTRVRQMFGAIARRYDLANHTLSCGIDFYWRKRAANTVASWRPSKIVDLATGKPVACGEVRALVEWHSGHQVCFPILGDDFAVRLHRN